MATRRPAPGRDFEQRVRGVIATLLAEGSSARVQDIAARLATSVRTLQRRLHAAGVTYAGALQEERCAVARKLLRDQAHGIGDVARTLGYSDPAHFTRAFHRWTGSSPSAFRRRS